MDNIRSNSKTMVKGAAILGAAGLLVKVLGAVFRIPLGNMVSESAMAYYQPAYFIYTFFVVVATSGLPTAIARMVSERMVVGDYRGAHKTFHTTLYLMLTIGILSFVILFFGAGPLSEMMHSPNAKYPMMAIAPAILFVPWMSAYRGYFQGMQNMNPTAVSQVVEQVFRVAVGLTLVYVLYRSAPSVLAWAGDTQQTASDVKGAMGAISGATVGSLAGLMIIAFIYLKSRKAIFYRIERSTSDVQETRKQLLRQILIIAVPITVGAAVMPIMNLIEVPIINNRLLDSGYSPEEADVLYGMLSGYVSSLINLPQVLTAALAMSLVPMVASVYTKQDRQALTYNTILGGRLAMIIGCPCAIGLAVLAKPIMLLLYPTKPQVAENSATCLAILAIGVIFLSLVQTMTAVLQGVGKQMIPVRNLASVVVIKVVLTWWLVGYYSLNIKGAAIATLIAYAVAAALDVASTQKYTGVTFPIGLTYIRPLVSSLIMGAAAWGIYHLLAQVSGSLSWNALATLISIFAAVIIYAVLLFVTGSVEREDLFNIPGGTKLVRIHDRITGTKSR